MKEITKKTPDPGGLTGEFYQTSKKEIVTIVHNSSRELKRMNTSQIHSSALQKTLLKNEKASHIGRENDYKAYI